MSYTGFNPIVNIINDIGYEWDVDGDGNQESCLTITYPSGPVKGNICYIPMYTTDEVRSGELPTMPFIEFTHVTGPGSVHNIQGDVRYDQAYIDMNIYAALNDEIDIMKTWMKTVEDEIYNQIMTWRHGISDCSWVEPIDNREIIEMDGKKVIYHNIISLYANRYDGPY